MKDLAALTPPFLMAAVVIAAIVLFLRHEMRRGRSQRPDLEDENPSQSSPLPDRQREHAANDGESDAAKDAAPVRER